MIQQTSLTAYLENIETLGTRQQTVLKAISTRVGICNQELAKLLGWEINRVTPRVQELRQMGYVEEAYRDLYAPTNRTVIYWKQKERKLEKNLLQFAEVE